MRLGRNTKRILEKKVCRGLIDGRKKGITRLRGSPGEKILCDFQSMCYDYQKKMWGNSTQGRVAKIRRRKMRIRIRLCAPPTGPTVFTDERRQESTSLWTCIAAKRKS